MVYLNLYKCYCEDEILFAQFAWTKKQRMNSKKINENTNILDLVLVFNTNPPRQEDFLLLKPNMNMNVSPSESHQEG